VRNINFVHRFTDGSADSGRPSAKQTQLNKGFFKLTTDGHEDNEAVMCKAQAATGYGFEQED